MRGIHRSPVNPPHKVQWRGALMFSLVCTWTNNNDADGLRRHRAHYDVTVMFCTSLPRGHAFISQKLGKNLSDAGPCFYLSIYRNKAQHPTDSFPVSGFPVSSIGGLSGYSDSHYQDKTVVRTSYLDNGNLPIYWYLTASLYWDGLLAVSILFRLVVRFFMCKCRDVAPVDLNIHKC